MALRVTVVLTATAWLFGAFLPPPAAADERRPLILAAYGGSCSFDDDRGLQSEATVGLRSGIGLGDFTTLWTDLSYSNPLRKGSTSTTSDVFTLRVLAQIDALRTRVAPYAVVGAGGVLYSFANEASNGAGVFVVGAGIRYRTGRTMVFAEGRGDMSRVRAIYGFGQSASLSSTRKTAWNESLVAGFGVEF